MIKLIVTLGVSLIAVVFQVAAKLRLTVPLLYVLAAAISTLFTDWVSQHEQLVAFGLLLLLALVAASWVHTLVQYLNSKHRENSEESDIAWQLRRARELGVPLDSVRFDNNNNLIDPRTGIPVNFSAGR